MSNLRGRGISISDANEALENENMLEALTDFVIRASEILGNYVKLKYNKNEENNYNNVNNDVIQNGNSELIVTTDENERTSLPSSPISDAYSINHLDLDENEIKKNIEFKFPTKPKYKKDIFTYFKSMWELTNHINQVSMFLTKLSVTLNSKPDNLIINKTNNFADILKATCSTTSTTPVDTPIELSITPLEANRIDQKLYEFIHYIPLPVEWCTPDNSEYESEEYDSEDGEI
nr:7939_t:CDS:2 [Entrophospora candida]